MNPKFKATLRRCQERKFLIEFDRRPQISEQITGFVLDFSDSLILLHVLEWSTFTLNGYVVVRAQDIKRQRVFGRKDCWQYKAARANKLKPIQPNVSISSIEEAIQSAAKAFPVITLEKEMVRDEACWIGRPAELTPKTILIHNLNTQAEWKGKIRFSLKDITRLAFGGGYETALAAAAKGIRKI